MTFLSSPAIGANGYFFTIRLCPVECYRSNPFKIPDIALNIVRDDTQHHAANDFESGHNSYCRSLNILLN